MLRLLKLWVTCSPQFPLIDREVGARPFLDGRRLWWPVRVEGGMAVIAKHEQQIRGVARIEAIDFEHTTIDLRNKNLYPIQCVQSHSEHAVARPGRDEFTGRGVVG
jgi:hypothetical protein